MKKTLNAKAPDRWVTLQMIAAGACRGGDLVSLYACISELGQVKTTRGKDMYQVIHLSDPDLESDRLKFVSLMLFLPNADAFPPANQCSANDIVRIERVKIQIHEDKPQLAFQKNDSQLSVFSGEVNTPCVPIWSYQNFELRDHEIDVNRIQELRAAMRVAALAGPTVPKPPAAQVMAHAAAAEAPVVGTKRTAQMLNVESEAVQWERPKGKFVSANCKQWMRSISELPGNEGANIIVQVLGVGFQFKSHHEEYFLDRFIEPDASSSAPEFESASAMLTKSIPESHWTASTEIELLLWDGSVLADQTFAPASSWSRAALSTCNEPSIPSQIAGSVSVTHGSRRAPAIVWPALGSVLSFVLKPTTCQFSLHFLRPGTWLHLKNIKSTSKNVSGECMVESQQYTYIDLVRNDDLLVHQRLEAYRFLLKLHGPSLKVTAAAMGRPTAASTVAFPDHPVSMQKSILFSPQKVGKFRIQARVVSVISEDPLEYCRMFCHRCCYGFNVYPPTVCEQCGTNEDSSWIFSIGLILRDATAQIRAVLTGSPAVEFFGGLEACDLRVNNVTRDLVQTRLNALLDPSKYLDACIAMHREGDNGHIFHIFHTRLL